MLGVGLFLRLQFDWLLLVFTALALSGANIIGYVRCKSGAHARARTCPAAVLRYGPPPFRSAALPPPSRRPAAPTSIHMHAALGACRRCEGEDHQCGDQPTRRQLRHPGHAERCGQGLRLLARGAACGEVAGPLWAQGGPGACEVRGPMPESSYVCGVCGGRWPVMTISVHP